MWALPRSVGSPGCARPTPPPRPLRHHPPHSRPRCAPTSSEGLDWLRFLRDHGLHGVLADEMGLGKTVQALAVLVDTPHPHPSLVVAPTSVLPNWVAEASKFAPSLKVLAWHGPQRDPDAIAHADVVVTTYALLRRDRDRLTARAWTYAILDEAQFIKNPASKVARAARALHAQHRLALTGTPLENDLLELWSLFAFLLPGYLGRRTHFQPRYRGATPEVLAELNQRLRPFVLRRRKLDVAPQLPPRTHTTLHVELSQPERRLYQSVHQTVVRAIRDKDADHARTPARILLEGLTRLRQACCDPALLPFSEARRVHRSSKLDALMRELLRALSVGSRCLVFSQWVRLLDQVSTRLTAENIAHLRLQGDTRDRGTVVAQFQADDGPPVFLISLKAGGTGLNLTAADVVFHLDPWWNPAAEDQATDRAHRIGQSKPVTVVRLVAADTVEQRIVALQESKRKLFLDTVERATEDAAPLDVDALRRLLGVPDPESWA